MDPRLQQVVPEPDGARPTPDERTRPAVKPKVWQTPNKRVEERGGAWWTEWDGARSWQRAGDAKREPPSSLTRDAPTVPARPLQQGVLPMTRDRAFQEDARQLLPPLSMQVLRQAGPVARSEEVATDALSTEDDFLAFLSRPGGFNALLGADVQPFMVWKAVSKSTTPGTAAPAVRAVAPWPLEVRRDDGEGAEFHTV